MKEFCTTGICIPEMHYMADTSQKITKIRALVDKGNYFTINRPRQYGKTTTLYMLSRALFNEYIAIRMSFEGVDDNRFKTSKAFCELFMALVQKSLKFTSVSADKGYIGSWYDPSVKDFTDLSEHISKMCEDRKLVLMIDEVDKISDNAVMLQFLGVLRNKFLSRRTGEDTTFHSVILAGVHDISNIKWKLINAGLYKLSDAEGSLYNSPWNIAANFNVDMSLSETEIASMLNEYENDCHTGMDIKLISASLYDYTSGYPFLVSRLCQIIDGDLSQDWTIHGVNEAAMCLLGEANTLFDDLFKNLENNPDLYRYIYDLLIIGKKLNFAYDNPIINWAVLYGFIKSGNGISVVSNRIFELRITEYFISKDSASVGRRIYGTDFDAIHDGRFDMEFCLRNFAKYYRELFSERDVDFIEEYGRLLFLVYLRPLINGLGFYHIESRLTDLSRMDLVVDFGVDEFIIELKLWRGNAYHQQGYKQLKDYIIQRGRKKGYLINFDIRKPFNRNPSEEWVDVGDGISIFDVVL